jgi:cardiolipin synthase
MTADRGVWTIPNLISFARLLCVPVFLWLLWAEERPVAAAALLAVLGATDWVDGYIARHFDQGSEVGKVLDPVADRVLLVSAGIALLTEDLPGSVKVLALVVLVREVLIAVATLVLAMAGAKRIDVVWAGKAGTLAIMFSLPALLVAEEMEGAAAVAMQIVGWGFGLAGVVLSWYAAAQYVPAARAALRDGRDGRASAPGAAERVRDARVATVVEHEVGA